MSFDPSQLVNPALLELHPYQPGKPVAECQRELGISHFIKLASNENPLGVSRYVTDHLSAEFSQMAIYPDGSAYALKQALSEHLHVEPAQIILGNGSEEVLKMIMQAFVRPDEHILMSEYSFISYKLTAKGFGIGFKEVPHKNYHVDLTALLAAITDKTKLIILANPNNPTGTYVTAQAFKNFLAKVPPQVLVVCDEAYYEYMQAKDYPETISWIAEHPNLIVTRTFSKAYGLAALRIGYAVANEQLIHWIERIRQPFNTNHLAQHAARLALIDQTFVQKSVALNQAGLAQIMEGLTDLEVEFIPSVGNFVMIKLDRAGKEVYESLLRQGIIIRPLDPYGLTEFIRVSVGKEEENAAFIQALAKVLQQEVAA